MITNRVSSRARGLRAGLSFLALGWAGALHAQAPAALSELELVQRQIERSRAFTAAAVVREHATFPHLASSYLRAYAPLLEAGARYSVVDEAGWAGPGGRGAEVHRRIEHDMRRWHPVFSLVFLETVLERGPGGIYAAMLALPGRNAEGAIEQRLRRRTLRLQEEGLVAAAAVEAASGELTAQRDRLWGVIASVARDNIVRILAEALEVDPLSEPLDLVPRVARVLDVVDTDGLYAVLAGQVREGPRSHTIPASIHAAVDAVMLRPGLNEISRDRRLSQLLELFAKLHNTESRDRLLLIFDQFDKYDPVLGERQFVFDATLNAGVVGFIEAGGTADPPGALALDVMHQLSQWLVKRVELDHPDLSNIRVVDVLDALRELHPTLLRGYIERFYRDFHALSPAGYETVVLHLTGILIDYALAGDFPRVDPEAKGDAPVPPQDRVMQVLRWYNDSMAEIGPRLPAVDLQFVEAEQREVIQRILGYFDVYLADDTTLERGIDRRFIETLLVLFQRVAHLADPEDVQERVIAPLFALAARHRDPRQVGFRQIMSAMGSFRAGAR